MKNQLVKFDASRQEFFIDGQRIHLAPKEMKLLLTLVEDKRAWSREQLLQKVWGIDADIEIDTRTIDQHVARLRKAVKVPLVETVTGFGYRLAPGFLQSEVRSAPLPSDRKLLLQKIERVQVALKDLQKIIS